MPLHVEVPPAALAGSPAPTENQPPPSISVGLVNNMPDTALEATETQFSSLLQAACGPLSVRLRLTCLPQVPRGGTAVEHIASRYWVLDELLRSTPDALIVTGAEPIATELHDEPYWRTFVQLVDWAQVHTISSIWSCLAAHAAVQHLSGVRRHRLAQKCCGIYEHSMLAPHPLTHGLTPPLITPHSRWNELPIDALRGGGYSILSAGTATGANIFTRQVGQSLMIFLQGHPEYEDTTLLREYRRDIGRFVRGQQSGYPTLPHAYFPPAALRLLSTFQEQAMRRRAPEVMADFPAAEIPVALSNTWGRSAVTFYANWLSVIHSTKRGRPRDTEML